MQTMKALRSFRVSDTNEGVKPGKEFRTTLGQQYEKRGYAVFVRDAKKPSAQKMNKAAKDGPLGSRGGETGAENAASSSPEDQAQGSQSRGSRRRAPAAPES